MRSKNQRFLVFGLFVTFLAFTCGADNLSRDEPLKSTQLKTIKNSDIHEFVLNNVGKAPPNSVTGEALIVDAELNIDSFDSINEANMDFTVGILLYLEWKDPRFVSWIKQGESNRVSFDYKSMERLWVPDIYFPNEKEASLHKVFVPNKLLTVNSAGVVSYTSRISLTLSCQMDLQKYPFDQQTCSIDIESFSLSEKSLKLRWKQTKNRDPIFIKDAIELPQFHIRSHNATFQSKLRRDSGYHTCLIAELILERRITYYIVQIYIPSIFVVLLSWVSFWLNVAAVPGRISLGVLTVLTTVTQSSGVNASLPRVSYTKAVDIWMLTCLLFVFAALIEFAVANVLSRKDINKGFKFRDIPILPRISIKKKKSKPVEVVIGEQGEMKLDPETDPTLPKSNSTPGHVQAVYLDFSARLVFPIVFALFNVYYWTKYL